MIDRLTARVSPEDAAYVNNLIQAVFFAVALIAVVRAGLRRGPGGALDRAVP